MTPTSKRLRLIETQYAAVQSAHWSAICAMGSFMAVFLLSYGFSDTRVGLTSAMMSAFTVVFQLLVSKLADTRSHVPIKRFMMALYVATVMGAVLIMSLPMSLGAMMLVYALSGALVNAVSGLLSAQGMQFINLGLPIQYGWPRGVGSIVYALAALGIGALVESTGPQVLMPVFIAACAASILALLIIPDPNTLAERAAPAFVQEKGSAHTTYRSILKGSPMLLLFLTAAILLYVGQAGSLLFLVRVVQGVGGGNPEFGLAIFIQGGIEMPAMFLAPWLLQRYRATSILVFSFSVYVVKGVLLAVAHNMAVVYAAMALSVFCFGLYGTVSVYFVDSLVSHGEKVRAQGLVSLCGNAGGLVSSLLAGVIHRHLGVEHPADTVQPRIGRGPGADGAGWVSASPSYGPHKSIAIFSLTAPGMA